MNPIGGPESRILRSWCLAEIPRSTIIVNHRAATLRGHVANVLFGTCDNSEVLARTLSLLGWCKPDCVKVPKQ